MNLKLVYFNATDRAEIIRWMLAYAKAPFEDMRIKHADWPALKKDYPIGHLPVLEYTNPKTGKAAKMVESSAITRAVAGFTGLAGKTPLEAIEADQAYECLRDVYKLFYKAALEKDAERKEEIHKKAVNETMPQMLNYLEKKVKENGGKYLTGSSYTYGDFAIATFVDCKREHSQNRPNEMAEFEKEYPLIDKLAKTVAEIPEVKQYLAKRPAPEKYDY